MGAVRTVACRGPRPDSIHRGAAEPPLAAGVGSPGRGMPGKGLGSGCDKPEEPAEVQENEAPRMVPMLKRSVPAAALGVLAAAAFAAPVAQAKPDPCGPRNLKKAFAAWADNADYFMLGNGNFESGSTGWTLG